MANNRRGHGMHHYEINHRPLSGRAAAPVGKAVPALVAQPEARATAKRRKKPRKTGLFVLLLAGVVLLAGAGLVFHLLTRPTPMEGPPFVIALDAGHGGSDVGAEGLIQEVELTERTVDMLYDMLKADKHFTPVRSRQPKEGKTPRQRALTAKKDGASLLFSVHGNAHTDSETYGFECFPVPPGRDWHEESLELAFMVAEEMQGAGARLRGEGGVRYAYYEDGKKVFREVSDTTVYPDESFGVLEYPECMAILVEQCFITSPRDMAEFGDEAGCRRAAECYYRAICRFFDNYM